MGDQGLLWNSVETKKLLGTSADLGQALKNTTGLKIREDGGMGSDFKLSLNGFSGKQVKLFLDGLPMDNVGTSLGLNNLPASIAERIDVYKGVTPVDLGSDALGGAINIVTRKQANFLDASLSAGSFQTQRFSLNAAYSHPKNGWTMRFMAFMNHSENTYRVYVSSKELLTGQSGTPAWYRRFHDGFASAGVQLQGGVTDRSWADLLLFGLVYAGQEKDFQHGIVMDEVYGRMHATSRSWAPSVKYKKDRWLINGLDLSIQSTIQVSSYQLVDTSARIYNWAGAWIPDASCGAGAGAERSRTSNINRDRDWLTAALMQYRLNSAQKLTWNTTYSNFHRKSFDAENPDAPANRYPSTLGKMVTGLSWLADWSGVKTTVFAKAYGMDALGFRTVDIFTDLEREESIRYRYVLPGFGGSMSLNSNDIWQFRASWEHTSRMPESAEIFGDGVFVVYSAGLKPEKSNNANLGVHLNVPFGQNGIQADLGLLHRMTSDYIRLDQAVSGGNRTMQNKGMVQTLGLESEVSYRFARRLNASVNITWQSLTDKQEFEQASGYTGGRTRNITYGFRLPNIPMLFGSANLSLLQPLGRSLLRLELDAYFTNQYYLVYSELGASRFNDQYIIPSQFSQDARVSWSKPGTPHQWTLECRNLTDRLLYDSYKLQKPGRSLMATYRYYLNSK